MTIDQNPIDSNRRIKKSFRLTREDSFSLLVSVAFCHFTLFSYIEVAIGMIPIVSYFKSFFFPILYAILIMMSYRRDRIKYIRFGDIGLVLFFVLSILFTIVIYPQNESFILDSMSSHILPCIPFFLLGLCFDFKERTMNMLGVMSCISVIVSTVYVFYYMGTGRMVTGDSGYSYNMYWSYLLLPNAILTINYAFEKKRIIPIICAIIGIVYILSMGTRGPAVILFAFLAITFFRKISANTTKKIIIIVVVIVLIVFLITSGVVLSGLKDLNAVLMKNGFSTRVIDHIISGDILSNTTGRSDIFDDLVYRLNDRLLIGYGVYGEWQFGYYSAHNMYLEVVFHFGIIIGFTMIIAYFWIFFKTFFQFRKSKIVVDCLMIFGLLVFIKGIFGGRYMENYVFFLLGLCLQLLRKHKETNMITL